VVALVAAVVISYGYYTSDEVISKQKKILFFCSFKILHSVMKSEMKRKTIQLKQLLTKTIYDYKTIALLHVPHPLSHDRTDRERNAAKSKTVKKRKIKSINCNNIANEIKYDNDEKECRYYLTTIYDVTVACPSGIRK